MNVFCPLCLHVYVDEFLEDLWRHKLSILIVILALEAEEEDEEIEGICDHIREDLHRLHIVVVRVEELSFLLPKQQEEAECE